MTMKTFSDGEVLYSADLNGNFDEISKYIHKVTSISSGTVVNAPKEDIYTDYLTLTTPPAQYDGQQCLVQAEIFCHEYDGTDGYYGRIYNDTDGADINTLSVTFSDASFPLYFSGFITLTNKLDTKSIKLQFKRRINPTSGGLYTSTGRITCTLVN